MKPQNYIETKWEPRSGFKYPQPVQYCQGIRLTFDTINNFEKLFNEPFSDALKKSNAYNNALKYSLYNSGFWTNQKAKELAFNKIYNFCLLVKSATGSSVTPLLPFEVFLMNDGFKMLSFCELSALNPGVSIVAESQSGDTYKNPKGLKFSRCYSKGKNFIYIAFGLEREGKKTNFYFQTSKSHHHFQVDNDIKNYKKAINGNLKPL